MDEHVAFIGLGSMGYGMASNLRKKLPKTSTLYIVDVDTARTSRFVDECSSYGPVVVVSSAREAAGKVTVLMTMVPNPEDARKLHLDPVDGSIAAEPRDGERLILDSSTIDPATSRDIGRGLREAGQGTYIDSPVAGGVLGSRAGRLTFMLGCPDTHPQAKRIHSLVSLMAHPDKIFHCGAPTTGLLSKIADNHLAGTYCVAISEAMALGIKSGVDPKVLFKLISNGSGGGWMFDNHQPVPGLVESAPSSRGYEPFFRHALMVKDLRFAVEAARGMGVEGGMAEKAVEVFERAMREEGLRDLDYTSVYRLINPDANSRPKL